ALPRLLPPPPPIPPPRSRSPATHGPGLDTDERRSPVGLTRSIDRGSSDGQVTVLRRPRMRTSLTVASAGTCPRLTSGKYPLPFSALREHREWNPNQALET